MSRTITLAARQELYLTRMRDGEASLQRKVLDLAALLGWRSYHTHNSQHSASGFPDLVLVRPPRVIFAELKSETGVFSVEQIAWLGALELCPGVETYRWRPSDLASIQQVLR